MKIIKGIIFFIALSVIAVCPFHAYFYLIPAVLRVADNLLTVIGLFIAYFTFWVTIGIALFIYWLQDRNSKREEQRRLEQSKAAMLLAVENAFELYFFMPEEDRDEHFCDGVKDVLSANVAELKKLLSAEDFDHLVKVVNTIYKKDCAEAYHYVRDWLHILYLSRYQEFMVCANEYTDLLDKKTFRLINALRGEKKKYMNLLKIDDNEGQVLFEKNGDKITVICNGKKWLDGVLGYNDIFDDPVILSGYGASDVYEGYYNDGFYDGQGIQFCGGHHKLKEGTWKHGDLINGTEYDYIFKAVSGKLIFKPNCPADPYDATADFAYEKYEQYGVEEEKLLSWVAIQMGDTDLDSYYVADVAFQGEEEQLINIRTLKEFLIERDPELLLRLDKFGQCPYLAIP